MGGLHNLNEDQLLKILLVKIEGDVAVFVENELLAETTKTYKEFKKRLLKQFAEKTLPGTAQNKLIQCKQEKGESVSKFATRIKAIGLELALELTERGGETTALIKKTCDVLVLHQFKTGLRRCVKHQIGLIFVREPDLTFEQAWEIATAAELLQGPDSSKLGDVAAVEEVSSDEENVAYVKSTGSKVQHAAVTE